MPKRILWLFNHTSLRKFEVPMLIEMGYEVYCPKKCNIFDFSASISYEYDFSLTIPEDVLRKLNEVDFYTKIPLDIINLLNEYFDIVFCLFEKRVLKRLAKYFNGAICLHIFGLQYPLNYTSILGNDLLYLFNICGSRFWFIPTYDNLTEIECPFLQKRTIYMPIGLVGEKISDTWIGGDKKIFFVSPKIKTSWYYEEIYKNFKRNFGDLPHLIGGAQPIPVREDKTVTGFLSNEEYEYNMKHLAGMYYHSQEPRHLHYHPLEAVKRGMPLIFMAGGMLDHLGGINLPGRAKNIKEARKKLQYLLNGDKSFIKSVTENQKILLQPFSMAYCRNFWKTGMKRIEESLKNRETDIYKKKRKRIAVVMPAKYTGGVLDYSIRFALNLHNSIKKHHDNAEVIFAYPEDDIYTSNNLLKKLFDARIPVRSFNIKIKNKNWILKTMELAGFYSNQKYSYSSDEYAIIHDDAADFADCDYIIFTSDAGFDGIPFFCLQPFAVVVHDYIQRYIPETVTKKMHKTKIINQKNADTIIVTSKPTFDDAVQFAGNDHDKICLTPLLLEVEPLFNEKSNSIAHKKYFLWPTNAAPHKNHIKALQALEMYYNNGGKLECYITGTNTNYLQPGVNIDNAPVSKEYVLKIQNIISKSINLKKYLRFQGNLPESSYKQILRNAQFLFHPGYGDNGNGAIMDAISVGVPALSSDYPAMHYMADFIGVELQTVTPFDAEKIAASLKEMELNRQKYVQKIPDYSILKNADYRSQEENLYNCVKEFIGF